MSDDLECITAGIVCGAITGFTLSKLRGNVYLKDNLKNAYMYMRYYSIAVIAALWVRKGAKSFF